ncbi:hypothetical protein LCGC14_0701930 [marine sediment metagenome]|uniref:N-acetyltransferase domain-containing protein n=1 Tax=marine sediment metagenome TaxID=412755 RepID=A0A0F9T3B9_9ZZZZ
MLIKTYTSDKIFARPKIVRRLTQLTNQSPPIDFYYGSAMRDDLRLKRTGQFFLAWSSRIIIAWASLNRDRYNGFWQIGVYVEPVHRRKGIGSKLCKKAKAFANMTGETIRFQDEHDGLGHDMYKKTGFLYSCRG